MIHIPTYIVDVERFAGLNIHSFNPIEVFVFTFPWSEVLIINYRKALISQRNFHKTPKNYKNYKSLAQWIFPHLLYT